MKFINRTEELQALENSWQEKESQLLIIYGKRRVGKTELIKRFSKDKRSVYFLARRISEKDNLKILGKRLGQYFKDTLLSKHGFTSWDDFFIYLKDQFKRKKIDRFLMTIDEFPYLAEANKGISSIFQAGWDEYLKDFPIFLILCGSSISIMEQETLAYKAPLYGRRTGQILVKPMQYLNVRNFFPKFSFEDKVKTYSICGGMPSYALKLKPYTDLETAIVNEILTPEKMLYDEVEFILKEELREPRNYFSILRAIAFNCTKLSEIMNETGIVKTALHNYLYVLEKLHLIEKRIPVTEKNPSISRKGRYYLKDQFFKFWFRYCLMFKGELEWRNTTPSLEAYKKSFLYLVAENYEKIAQEILHTYQNKLFSFHKIGKWWNQDTEIDVVAFNNTTLEIVFGEVKWTNERVGKDIYYALKEKVKKVPWNNSNRHEYFCLFSRNGFTQEMKKIAKKEKVFLFEKDKLL